MVKKSKFLKLISDNSSEALVGRAATLAELAEIEVNAFIDDLNREKLNLRTKLNRLTDLAPNNITDLKLSCDNFDAKSWIKNVHTIKMDMRLLTLKLEEAKTIRKEWFEEEVIKVKK